MILESAMAEVRRGLGRGPVEAIEICSRAIRRGSMKVPALDLDPLACSERKALSRRALGRTEAFKAPAPDPAARDCLVHVNPRIEPRAHRFERRRQTLGWNPVAASSPRVGAQHSAVLRLDLVHFYCGIVTLTEARFRE